MRKWVVIGLLAIIGVAVLVYIVSQPGKGSLEWHKREYLDAQGRGDAAWLEIARIRSSDRVLTEKDLARAKFHENELIRRGYLEEWRFIVSNGPAQNVLNAIFAAGVPATGPRGPLGQYEVVETNIIRVVITREGASGYKSRLEKAIRKLDVPQNGK